ncbi:hypothetical protein MHU86_23725 [Fragilaria crotonensis]|nr:hypothetical protein MHU86_23725 [Fragilaria crotonensis]
MSTNWNQGMGWRLGVPVPVRLSNQSENRRQPGSVSSDGRFMSQAPLHLHRRQQPSPPKSRAVDASLPPQPSQPRRSRWGTPLSKSSRQHNSEQGSVLSYSSPFQNQTRNTTDSHQTRCPATTKHPPAPPQPPLYAELGTTIIIDSMEQSGNALDSEISVHATHHTGKNPLSQGNSAGTISSIVADGMRVSASHASKEPFVESSENVECGSTEAQVEDHQSTSARFQTVDETIPSHAASPQVDAEDDRQDVEVRMEIETFPKMADGEDSKCPLPSNEPHNALILSHTDVKQSAQRSLFEDSDKSGTMYLDKSEDSTSVVQKATLVRLAKMKLRHAKLQLVTALTRQQSLAESPTLPPITALSQPLFVQNILSKDKSLVQLLPEPALTEGECNVVIPYHSDNEDDQRVPDDLHQKSKELRKNLLLLKKENLELTLRNHEHASASLPQNEEVTEPRVFDKQALKRRQEELQQTVDAAYWKRLVIQQRNLLAAERKEVLQHEQKLLSCQEEIKIKQESIWECERKIDESRVREKCVDEMIEKAVRGVLNARKRRHEMQGSRQSQPKKSRFSNHDVIDLTSP